MSGAIALMVEFDLMPERRRDFPALMQTHAKPTLEAEPGCEQFDVLDSDDDSLSVFLCERYRDATALQAHMNSGLFASTRGGYDDIITGKPLVRCTFA